MAKIDFYELAVKSAQIAEDKKAIDTIILDVRNLTVIANYFVVTTVQSTTQINAISAEIEKIFKEQDMRPLRKDGVSSSTWRVVDYGGIIIHVMSPEMRASYKLETLWDKAKLVEIKKQKIKVKKQAVAKKLEKPKAKTGALVKRAVKKIVKKTKKIVKGKAKKK
ncbi:MAG: ribosome silencing factor [Endomicrobium sp.]|uniref:ribosome silencing factor n=1 Tax=Candidatus Endomicrobiellum pyrsonymphae TaxID=1408203 RepID=UPI0035725B34|nr:ribosome silencing factor [Endomicrobium sp.]